MHLLLHLLLLLPFSLPHRVGLLLNSVEPDTATAIRDVANYTVSQLVPSSLTLVVQEYNSSYLGLLEGVCALLEEGVVAVVSNSNSAHTAVESELASQVLRNIKISKV